MHPPVLWIDEKLFPVQAIYNHQNDRIYAKSKDSIPVNMRLTLQTQKPASVMVWGGVLSPVTGTGLKTPLVFIDEGVKINKDTYLKLLKKKFVAIDQFNIWRRWNHPSTRWSTLHMANLVQNWCKNNMACFWTKKM